jgi:hypothetical protein
MDATSCDLSPRAEPLQYDPLMWDEPTMDRPVSWVEMKSKYFSLWGWTDPTTPNVASSDGTFHVGA